MRVSSILPEVALINGKCEGDTTKLFRLVTRAVQRLATTGLFDPLIGYLDIAVDGNYFVSLPYDVKTPLRLNINNSPAFARSRIYEFAQNSDGTTENAERGTQWADRGYSPVLSEYGLPGPISCVCVASGDAGKVVKVKFKDADGLEWTEDLTLSLSAPAESTHDAAEIIWVLNPSDLLGEIYLKCGNETLSRYYPFETEPNYRVIKLSQTGVAVRIMYRKHVFAIKSQDDYIPLNSEMAVILMCKAIQLDMDGKPEEASKFEEKAIKYLKDEQGTSTENETLAASQEAQSAINANIFVRDAVICADVYDTAAEVFGPVGREKLFDRITSAIEALANKSQWDSLLGVVDIWKPANCEFIELPNGRFHGTGLFVLPRYVDTVLALTYSCSPNSIWGSWLQKAMPRNQWAEFHLNGLHNRDCAPCGSWEELGESVIINPLTLDAHRKPIPRYLTAVPDDPLDEGISIKVYGYDLDGRELGENALPGFEVPCRRTDNYGNGNIGPIARFTRIVKQASRSFVRLYGWENPPSSTNTETPLLLGYWYPDEVEPKYRLIRVPNCCETRIRVLYRKRSQRVSSLYDPLHLRSRMAIENMLRSMQYQAKGDPTNGAIYEAMAIRYLEEEQSALNPHDSMGLQVDEGTIPNHAFNFA